MPYDLIIRNGTIIDGSGLPRYQADVGITQGRVASIGKRLPIRPAKLSMMRKAISWRPALSTRIRIWTRRYFRGFSGYLFLLAWRHDRGDG